LQTNHTKSFEEGENTEKTRISSLTPDRVTKLLPEELKHKNSKLSFFSFFVAFLNLNSAFTGPEFVSWLVEELKEEHIESDEILKSNFKIYVNIYTTPQLFKITVKYIFYKLYS